MILIKLGQKTDILSKHGIYTVLWENVISLMYYTQFLLRSIATKRPVAASFKLLTIGSWAFPVAAAMHYLKNVVSASSIDSPAKSFSVPAILLQLALQWTL